MNDRSVSSIRTRNGLTHQVERYAKLTLRAALAVTLVALLASPLSVIGAPPRTSLTIESSPNPSLTTDTITVGGLLKAGTPLPNKNIQVQCRPSSVKSWTTITVATTGSDGRFSASWRPPAQGKFYLRAVFPGDKQYKSSTSNSLLETVNVLETVNASSFSIPAPPTGTLVFSAYFESGDHSGWNWYPEQQPQDSLLSVSSQIVHSGMYSGYYFSGGLNADGLAIRAYPSEMLDPRPAKFYVSFWVYVPSVLNGVKVSMTNDEWISFASIWLNLPPAYPWNGPVVNPITINSFSNQQLYIWLGPLKTESGPNEPYYFCQTNPIMWSFDKWFSIGVYGEVQPSPASSSIIVYQDGIQIIKYVGNLGSYSTGLGQMHFGLYAYPTLTTIAIYNDDIEVYSIP